MKKVGVSSTGSREGVLAAARLSALCAIAVACILLVSCGHKRHGATDASTVGSGLAVPRAGLRPAPTTVPLADVLKQIDAYSPPSGVDATRFATLKAELRHQLVARSKDGGKTISIAPNGYQNAVTNLSAVADAAGTKATLAWTEVLPGDFDNDGEVDIADLVPLALYYGQSTNSGPNDGHLLVQGDSNPSIDIGDLQAVVLNYSARIQGYQVWRGHWNGIRTDWEATPRPNPNPASTGWSADRPSPPPVSTRPTYTYMDDISGVSDKANIRYVVVPFGDGAAGAMGNEAAMQAYNGLADSPWPKFRGNAQGTGLSPYVGAQTNNVKWTYIVGSGAQANSPVIGADGLVYVGTTMIYVLNPVDGSLVRTLPYGGETAAIGADGSVYTSYYGDFTAMNADGVYVWEKTFYGSPLSAVGETAPAPPAIGADGTVYLASTGTQGYSGLLALDPANGKGKWSYYGYSRSVPSAGTCPAIGADGTICVGGDNSLYAVSPIDGSIIWTCAVEAGGGSPAIGTDGTVFFGGRQSVYAINPASGAVKWRCPTGGQVESSPAISADGVVYAGSYDHNVYAVDAATGSLKWTHATGAAVRSSPAVGADGTVYVGSEDKSVYALNPADGGVKWSYATGGQVDSSPAISADGTVYVTSADGKLYAFGAGGAPRRSISGTVTESGVGLAGVTMMLTPRGLSAVTQADGTYTIQDVPEGTYTLTPYFSGYAATPACRTVTVSGSDATAQDFVVQTAVGLGDTPWPKYRGNSFNSSRSDITGAQTSHVKWTSVLEGAGSLSVGRDGTLYVSSGYVVYALGPTDGNPKWAVGVFGSLYGPVAVGADGTLYFETWYPHDPYYGGILNAICPDGKDKWSVSTGGNAWTFPAISDDGTLYVEGCAVNPVDGSVNWHYPYASHSSVAIGADGTLYVGGDDQKLYALNGADGSVKWSSPLGGTQNCFSPAIGPDGTIFAVADKVYAFDPADGSLKWSFTTGNYFVDSLAVSANGVVYAVTDYPEEKLFSLNAADGSVNWSFAVNSLSANCQPAIGADGTVYVGSLHSVYALNPVDGGIKWGYTSEDFFGGDPAIGADGTVYFGCYTGKLEVTGKLYAFGP